MNLGDIWLHVIDALKTNHNLSDITVNLWFDSMEMKDLTSDTVYLSTDNDIKKNIIESKYADIIKEELKNILGFEVEIVIVSCENESFEEQYKRLSCMEKSERLKQIEKKLDEESVSESSERPSSLIISPSLLPEYSPEYTFDSFVVGHSNDLAYNMALSVANQPAMVANPLYLYGSKRL